MKRLASVLIALALAVAMLGLAGCQQLVEKATQTAVEKSTGVKVEKDGSGFSVETSQGKASVSSAAELPADFPSDVPVYKPNTVKAVVTSDTNGKTGYLVNMESTDSATKVMDWYKSELKTQGWKVVNTVDVGSGTGGMNAEKDANTLLVAIAKNPKDETGSTITLTLSPKQQ